VPEKQMLHFIAVAGNYEQQVVFLYPDEIKAKIGSRVRVRDGVFKGVEGILVKIRNNKRVVVQIEGLLVVATHYIHPSLLESLE
ncbi:MAG: transcriptional regulator, partial [Petrimonas sp.]|nr:transcriptional regulator [Petrimonas sp.]